MILYLEKKIDLHNVIILLKSVGNKDQNHYYQFASIGLKIMTHFFDSIIMLRFGETKVAKEVFYGA